jgi:light-regulated signal transduction histidine kinase (bacteriophytochrome)
LSNGNLRRANEVLNRFAYSASHDLQEPLRPISIFSQLLQEKVGSLDASADDHLRFLMKGSARIEALVRDLFACAQASGVGDESAPLEPAQRRYRYRASQSAFQSEGRDPECRGTCQQWRTAVAPYRSGPPGATVPGT